MRYGEKESLMQRYGGVEWVVGQEKASENTSHSGGSKRLEDIRLEIQAFEDNFMIGVAAKERNGNELPRVLTNFTSLQIEDDIMAIAQVKLEWRLVH